MCHKRHITGRVSGQDGASHTTEYFRSLWQLLQKKSRVSLSTLTSHEFADSPRHYVAGPQPPARADTPLRVFWPHSVLFLYTHGIWAGTDAARLNVSCISEEGYRKQETLRADPIRRPWHCCLGKGYQTLIEKQKLLKKQVWPEEVGSTWHI